jgi:hypothetical protein
MGAYRRHDKGSHKQKETCYVIHNRGCSSFALVSRDGIVIHYPRIYPRSAGSRHHHSLITYH